MGEAKRRRDYNRAHADEITADLERRRAQRLRLEEMSATGGAGRGAVAAGVTPQG